MLILLGGILLVLGVTLLVLSTNQTLEERTIEQVHKNLRTGAIWTGSILTVLGVFICLWSLASRFWIKKGSKIHPTRVLS